jgi:hypothetical protein
MTDCEVGDPEIAQSECVELFAEVDELFGHQGVRQDAEQ